MHTNTSQRALIDHNMLENENIFSPLFIRHKLAMVKVSVDTELLGHNRVLVIQK